MTNPERFEALLCSTYRNLFAHDPEYAFAAGHTTPEALATKMTQGLGTGDANKDGAGIRRTCRALGIPHTYKAIRAFLSEGE